MSKRLSDLALIELVPPSIAGQKSIMGMAQGAGLALADVENQISAVLILSRIDDLPIEVLDLLGWQFHVDFWDPAASIERKREMVKASIRIHRLKGTPAAIEMMMKAGFDLNADVLEWFQYGGEPYYFRVSIEEQAVDDPQKLIAAINTVKNTRSWLDRVILHQRAAMTMGLGCGAVGAVESVALAVRNIEGTSAGTLGPAAGTMGGVEDTAWLNLDIEMTVSGFLGPIAGNVGAVEGFTVFNDA